MSTVNYTAAACGSSPSPIPNDMNVQNDADFDVNGPRNHDLPEISVKVEAGLDEQPAEDTQLTMEVESSRTTELNQLDVADHLKNPADSDDGDGDDDDIGDGDHGDDTNGHGDDHEVGMQTIEFIMSTFLPSEIPKSVLSQSSDDFTKIVESTFKENIKFFIEFVWKLQDKAKMSVRRLDLALPPAYSTQLRNAKSLMENIVRLTCQVVKKTDYLALPELEVQTLHSFIHEKKIFQAIDISDAEISIRFTTAASLPHVTQYSTDIAVKFASEKLCDIICTFAPANQDHVAHHPAKIQLLCDEEEFRNSKTVQTALKVRFKKIKMKCSKCSISFNDTQVLGRKKSSIACKQKTAKQVPYSGTRANQHPTSLLQQVMQISQKPGKLTTISKNNPVRFTFDSFAHQLNTFESHACLNTAYGYWQLEAIHPSTTGVECTIAIIDDGIYPGHPAIQNKILNFWNFSDTSLNANPYSPTSHGTMCAGIACGNSFTYFPGQNSDGVKSAPTTFPNGVAPDTKMLFFKVAYEIPESDDQIYRALKRILEWHDQRLASGNPGVDVVSLSMGSPRFVPQLAQVITELVLKSIIIVCAASNLGHKFIQPICFPARLGHVLCIGSHGPHGKPSDFSPVGQQIDFLAPGKDISAPANSHHIATDSGTSYATPAVAGLICLILDYIKKHYSPQIVQYFHNNWGIKEILREISTSPGRHSDDRGYGALNPIQFFLQPDRILDSIRIQSTLN